MTVFYNGYYINVILLEDSCGVPGSVCHNKDDSYSIFINANLCYEKQQEVFMHELRHILGDDFGKDNVQQIEFNNHGSNEAICDDFLQAI